MAAITEFFEEINEVFGFYFDIGLACHKAKTRLEEIQRQYGLSDDSPFTYLDAPPQGPPEQEIKKALHVTPISTLKQRLGEEGFDMLKAAEAVVIIVYHIWEEKYRRNLTDRDGKPMDDIGSDIMGDLRLVRNSIIHNKGIAKDDIVRCKVLKKFKPGDRIALTKSDINQIIRAITADLSR
ncbi:MAG: hypothetical protein ACJ74Q_09975 [Pyrinomonadaceae bacterium]